MAELTRSVLWSLWIIVYFGTEGTRHFGVVDGTGRVSSEGNRLALQKIVLDAFGIADAPLDNTGSYDAGDVHTPEFMLYLYEKISDFRSSTEMGSRRAKRWSKETNPGIKVVSIPSLRSSRRGGTTRLDFDASAFVVDKENVCDLSHAQLVFTRSDLGAGLGDVEGGGVRSGTLKLEGYSQVVSGSQCPQTPDGRCQNAPPGATTVTRYAMPLTMKQVATTWYMADVLPLIRRACANIARQAVDHRRATNLTEPKFAIRLSIRSPRQSMTASRHRRLVNSWVVTGQQGPLLVLYYNLPVGLTSVFNDSGARNPRRTRRQATGAVNEQLPKAGPGIGTVNNQTTTSGSGSSNTNCSLHVWYIDFQTLGWNQWIINPNGILANYCQGDCNIAVLRQGMLTTNHAFLKSLYFSRVGLPHTEVTSGSCCVPVKYSSTSILYRNKENHHVYSEMHEMVATQCGCL